MSYLFSILMSLTAVFLILLVLIQRGRGGGLAGAFGGMGGQSAFGTKAGDLFTRITMVTATFWILLCVASIAVLNSQHSAFGTASPGSTLDTTLDGAAGSGAASQTGPGAASQTGPGAAGQAGDPGTTPPATEATAPAAGTEATPAAAAAGTGENSDSSP